MKINYDIRASFEETLDDDISCILKLFSDKDVSKLSIAEIPTNKDRNISLHKHFKKVEMYDINQQVIQNLQNTYHISNLKFGICDFTNISDINVDCLISMRQSFQMFDLEMIKSFFKSLKLNKYIKYLIFDLYNFNSKNLTYAPSYLTKNCTVKSRYEDVIYIRETDFTVKDKKVFLCHKYYKNGKIHYIHNINMYNHNVEDIINLLRDNNLKFTIYNKKLDKQYQDEYQIFFVEVS